MHVNKEIGVAGNSHTLRLYHNTRCNLPFGKTVMPRTSKNDRWRAVGMLQAGDVRRRLRENGLQARRPAVRPQLLPRHRAARLAWARQHLRFTIREWRHVLFTDESRFQLSFADGRHRVYRRRGERYADNCIMQRAPYGGGGVMVWGGISAHHRTQC